MSADRRGGPGAGNEARKPRLGLQVLFTLEKPEQGDLRSARPAVTRSLNPERLSGAETPLIPQTVFASYASSGNSVPASLDLRRFTVCKRRRRWHPALVLLPGKSHGRRSLVGCSPWGREESDTTERLHFHFSLSCIGEGTGNPLQCSCLENPGTGELDGLPSMGSHRVGRD